MIETIIKFKDLEFKTNDRVEITLKNKMKAIAIINYISTKCVSVKIEDEEYYTDTLFFYYDIEKVRRC